jgi:transposase-like protein
MDGTEMRKSRFTQEQIVGFIKLVEAGGSVKELGRTHGFSDASFYKWRATYGSSNAIEFDSFSERYAGRLDVCERTSQVGYISQVTIAP